MYFFYIYLTIHIHVEKAMAWTSYISCSYWIQGVRSVLTSLSNGRAHSPGNVDKKQASQENVQESFDHLKNKYVQ